MSTAATLPSSIDVELEGTPDEAIRTMTRVPKLFGDSGVQNLNDLFSNCRL